MSTAHQLLSAKSYMAESWPISAFVQSRRPEVLAKEKGKSLGLKKLFPRVGRAALQQNPCGKQDPVLTCIFAS